MRYEEEEKEPAFKIVDKRRFTAEGSLREGVLENDEVSPKTNPEIPKPTADKPNLEMTFSLFVQSMAHQAMLGLGMMPWPDSNLIKSDLRVAKEAIDVLRMLKDKTMNNLSLDENRMIDTLLYQLQMAFVETTKSPTGDLGNMS